MNVWLLTSECSSDGWGKPIQVFSSFELAINYCIRQAEDFVRQDGCKVVENSVNIQTFEKNKTIRLAINVLGISKEDDWPHKFGLDRYLYEMKLQGDKNDRTKD
jgi:hypothetical protein